MTYFIVEAPYEKGFDYFFKNEYGYPNFYRMTELLPTEQKYTQYILLAPNLTNAQELMDRIAQQAQTQGFRYFAFEADLSTTFEFNGDGHLCTSKPFRECLAMAMARFASELKAPPPAAQTHRHRENVYTPTPTAGPGGCCASTTPASLSTAGGASGGGTSAA